MTESRTEVWLRGPVEGVPRLLQPVAHALLQVQEDVHQLTDEFPDGRLWDRPGGVASVGFHLQHLAGVLDRLFTYARGDALTPRQLQDLKSEGEPRDVAVAVRDLVARLDDQVARALEQLRRTDESRLTDARTVGRQRLPSTALGLLAHAAEHSQRHVGQLLVTVRIQQERKTASAERIHEGAR